MRNSFEPIVKAKGQTWPHAWRERCIVSEADLVNAGFAILGIVQLAIAYLTRRTFDDPETPIWTLTWIGLAVLGTACILFPIDHYVRQAL